jgi:hypothetical protein
MQGRNGGGGDRSGCTTDPLPAKRAREMFLAASGLAADARDPFGLNGSRGGKGRHMDTCVVELSCTTQRYYPLSPASVDTGCEITRVGFSHHGDATGEEADEACGPMLEDVLRSGDWRGMDVARFGFQSTTAISHPGGS